MMGAEEAATWLGLGVPGLLLLGVAGLFLLFRDERRAHLQTLHTSQTAAVEFARTIERMTIALEGRRG